MASWGKMRGWRMSSWAKIRGSGSRRSSWGPEAAVDHDEIENAEVEMSSRVSVMQMIHGDLVIAIIDAGEIPRKSIEFGLRAVVIIRSHMLMMVRLLVTVNFRKSSRRMHSWPSMRGLFDLPITPKWAGRIIKLTLHVRLICRRTGGQTDNDGRIVEGEVGRCNPNRNHGGLTADEEITRFHFAQKARRAASADFRQSRPRNGHGDVANQKSANGNKNAHLTRPIFLGRNVLGRKVVPRSHEPASGICFIRPKGNNR